MISLALADNQDNSGATATVSGSPLGSVNSLYTCDVRRLQLGNILPWTLAATRSGDGTVTVPFLPNPGYFMAYVSSQVSGQPPSLSNVAYANVSPSPLAVIEQIRNAVQARIQTVNLSGPTAAAGITSDRVYKQAIPSGLLQAYPCVVISLEDEQETVTIATNVRDDIEYPVHIFIMDTGTIPLEDKGPTILLWRERIMSAFRSQALPNVPSVWKSTVQPKLVLNAALAKEYQHVISAFSLRFFARLARG